MAKRKLAESAVVDGDKPTSVRRSTRRKVSQLPAQPAAKPEATSRTSKAYTGKTGSGATPAKSRTKIETAETKLMTTTSQPQPTEDGGRNYWLLKAEPEMRFENGVDVKFSIDDLAARTEPEPWDGIRNYAARNNLRAMKKGDLAFFYHSNCKEPGIVGTMKIVQEHSPDLSAHDPKAAYYDASSKPADPKWSVVHVVFHSKFEKPVTLKTLRDMGGPGQPLADMQMLRQTRLSVSKVSAAEWAHLMGIAQAQ